MSDSGSDFTTRRGLLRVLAQNARERAREVAPIIRSARLDLEAIAPGFGEHEPDAPGVQGAPEYVRTAARVPAQPTSVDELIDVANSEGLTDRDGELRALAQCTLRMTPTDPSCAGAWVLTSEEWTAPGGSEVLAAQIDLSAAAAHQSVLPRDGWLALFVGPVPGAVDSEARPAHGVVLDFPAEPAAALEPMALNAELVTPRRWHEAVEALEFDDIEADAYVRVRARVRDLQGVEYDEDGGVEVAYHRLLGYPNETVGTMPWECVRAVPEDAPQPGQWRLLAQISVGAWRRLYVWIHEADLELGRFDNLCAFVR